MIKEGKACRDRHLQDIHRFKNIRVIKKLFLFLTGTLMLHSAWAQSTARDSLLRLLSVAREDTVKIDLLFKVGMEYETESPQTSAWYYNEARRLSTKLKYDPGILRAAANYTYLLNMTSKFDSSAKMNREAVELARKIKDTLALAKALFNTGTSFRLKGEYARAVGYYEEGKKLFKAIGNENSEGVGDDILQVLYTDLHQFDKGREHGERAVAYFRKQNDQRALGIALNNLGNNYSGLNMLTEAQKAFEEALKIASETGDLHMELSQHLNLGGVLVSKREYDKLYPYFSKALVLADKLEIPSSKALALKGLSYYYHHRHDLVKARETAMQAFQIVMDEDLRTERAGVLDQLSNVAYASGDPALGAYYSAWSGRLQDSLIDESILRNTQELEVKYETARRDDQIKQLEAEQNIQRLNIRNKNLFILVLAILAAAITTVVVLLYRSYRHRQRVQQLRINELETEKQLMATEAVLKGEEQERARMAKDLHDGLGGMLSGLKYSLNSVKGNLIMTPAHASAFERSLDMLDSSIGEMRRIAHNMLPEALITFGLDNALNGFCRDINSSGALKVHYESMNLQQVDIEQSKAITVYRIVQELMNNILKHASASSAIVQLSRAGDQLHITVEDNGIGIDQDKLEKNEGMGWSNIRNRVNLLNGRVDVDSGKGRGTSVFIEIPL
ncbi:sensor histidine kinase [Nostoc ellipsosporum NOK]|nr:sensor histidine kinase [Nostoc ellipsosporum NOK]